MAYFTKEFNDFFKELSQNNNTTWFHKNKKRYEEHVKEPFEDFVAEVISRMQKEDPDIKILPKDAIFRINRDVRFSKDKKPYKEHMAAVVTRDGKKGKDYPGIFFHIGKDGIHVGGGLHRIEAEDIEKARRAISKNMKEFSSLVDDKVFKKKFGGLKGDKNKVVPAEFKNDVEKQPYIANKEFYFMAEYKDPKTVLRDDLADFIMDHYKAGSKLTKFLKDAIE
ncbi:DUF2461 domain-containing protein [Patescibacteria group bacterium]|nr:DUF2461 domain-containing protein [Patescibacteria group bacterium]